MASNGVNPESKRPLGPDDLPLPDPYPDYMTCPHCNEPEVEVWCFQVQARCHRCGQWFPHRPPACFGTSDVCRQAARETARLEAPKPEGSEAAGQLPQLGLVEDDQEAAPPGLDPLLRPKPGHDANGCLQRRAGHVG